MSNSTGKRLYVAIPLMNESEALPFLLDDIRNQKYQDFHVVYCVNQPEAWWSDSDKMGICQANLTSMEMIRQIQDHSFTLIDRSSPGLGWVGKKSGVGMARKTGMDACLTMAGKDTILLSLDADTRFDPGYFASVVTNFDEHIDIQSIAIPYYHPLTGHELLDRAMLRYEIYMRYYAIQLWRIGSPYSFTALGSAMAVRMKAYEKIGGMTPMKSGEDFYFLQKLRKYAPMLFWNPIKVFPANRLSDRVFFGTGPALIKGIQGDWESYPLYDSALFDNVAITINCFPDLFHRDVETPMDDFLKDIFKEDQIWEPIRRNHTLQKNFVRACHEKVDALRILQYLKSNTNPDENQNICNLNAILSVYNSVLSEDGLEKSPVLHDFENSDSITMNKFRDLLASVEEKFQKQHYLSIPRK